MYQQSEQEALNAQTAKLAEAEHDQRLQRLGAALAEVHGGEWVTKNSRVVADLLHALATYDDVRVALGNAVRSKYVVAAADRLDEDDFMDGFAPEHVLRHLKRNAEVETRM